MSKKVLFWRTFNHFSIGNFIIRNIYLLKDDRISYLNGKPGMRNGNLTNEMFFIRRQLYECAPTIKQNW